jgi:hypothetical protein
MVERIITASVKERLDHWRQERLLRCPQLRAFHRQPPA